MNSFSSAIVMLADGARPDVVEDLLRQGDLPNIERYILETGFFKTALTVFPSTTGPAYLPFVTGAFPGSCDIPGIRWFDRGKTNRFKPTLSRFRSYVGPESYLFNRDMSRDVKTIFEVEPSSHAIQSIASRGAGFRDLNRLSRWAEALYSHQTHNWLRFDRSVAKRLVAQVKRSTRFIYAAFPAIDEYSHIFHPHHKKTLDAYRQFDFYVGEVAAALKSKGTLDETVLVVCSDHGLTRTDTHFCLIDFFEKHSFRPFYYPKIYRYGCDVAIMQSGNAMAHIYLRDSDGWERAQTYERLVERGLIHVIQELASEPAVAWVAMKQESGGMIIVGPEGEGILKTNGGFFEYKPVGTDPLEICEDQVTWTPDDSLGNTFWNQYPDAFVQLEQIFRSKRAGDVIVVAHDGCDLRKGFEIPKHNASHGSLSALHMRVPVMMSHPVSSERPIRTVDIYPTLLRLLGIETKTCMDGKSLI